MSVQKLEEVQWFDGYKTRLRWEVKCECGEIFILDRDDGHGIDCPNCDRIYNLSGQELAPRSQWDDRYDEDSTQPYCIEFGYCDEY